LSIGGHHDKLLIFEPQKNKAGVLGENYWPAASHWQTLSHNVVSSTPHHEWDSNSNYYMIDKYFIIGNHDIILDVIDYLVSALI
jgi:hypothetical protein